MNITNSHNVYKLLLNLTCLIRALVYSKNSTSPKDVQCRQVLLYLDGYCNYMNERK